MNKKISNYVKPEAAFVILPAGTPGQVGNLVFVMNGILGFIWPIFVGFAIIAFIVAGFLFLTANGDGGKIKTARDAVIWGTVGIVVGILAFSIPWVVGNTLGTGIG